jgi:uracil-DNA glycosylase family protein
LREAAARCRGCHLWRPATQTVFGEGLKRSRVMFVGEQPGDREDRQGRPFVGPAGKELDRALEAVGIARDDVYITNVVKHFKFEERGRRRIHQTPKRFEIEACRPWLDAEMAEVKPEALVLLGATAAKALLGASFRITRQRASCSTPSWRRSCRPPSTPRRSCARPATPLAPPSARLSRGTSGPWPRPSRSVADDPATEAGGR